MKYYKRDVTLHKSVYVLLFKRVLILDIENKFLFMCV